MSGADAEVYSSWGSAAAGGRLPEAAASAKIGLATQVLQLLPDPLRPDPARPTNNGVMPDE